MPSRRFTILIADRTSGVVRRVSLSVRPALVVACAAVTLPVLMGIGSAWKARTDVADLYANQKALEIENASYRSATEELAGQITSLQAAIADLGSKSALDPTVASAIEKLPALVKTRAMGGGTAAVEPAKADSVYAKTLSALASPDDTFGLLRTLLEGLESRLHVVRNNVDKRNALAEATPSIWPAHGWLSSTMGRRTDPVNGGADFHAGLDIAGDKGQPVYATAAGTIIAGRLPGRLRQPHRCRSRFRSGDALRTPLQLRRRARAITSSAATSSAASARPAAPPAITCTTRCSPTASSSTPFSCSRSRSRATASSPPPRVSVPMCSPRLQSVDIHSCEAPSPIAA